MQAGRERTDNQNRTKSGRVSVSLEETGLLVRQILSRWGYSQGDSEIISKVILYAEVRNSTQGLLKLCGAGMPPERDAKEILTARSGTFFAAVDAQRRSGMVAMQRAIETALELAKEHKLGLVSMRNTSSSTGAIGYFARQIAEAGMIGIVASATPALVTPIGAAGVALGTNPLAIAIPTETTPMVHDITTAAIPMFDVLKAKSTGAQLPTNVALDLTGKETTDPVAALAGSLLPFGGARGSGLALALEILTGAFVGAESLGTRGKRNDWGNLAIALDPGIFVDQAQFLSSTQTLFDKIRCLPRAAGYDEILIPGERGNLRAAQVAKHGFLEINQSIYQELLQLAQQHTT